MFLLIIWYDFHFLLSKFCYIIRYIRKVEVHVQITAWSAPWKIPNGAEDLVMYQCNRMRKYNIIGQIACNKRDFFSIFYLHSSLSFTNFVVCVSNSYFQFLSLVSAEHLSCVAAHTASKRTNALRHFQVHAHTQVACCFPQTATFIFTTKLSYLWSHFWTFSQDPSQSWTSVSKTIGRREGARGAVFPQEQCV
jgi:hypothetical protein